MRGEMHYYCCSVLARAAGLNRETATNLSYANYYVDHSVKKLVINHSEGAQLVSEATAHHWDDNANLDREDQRQVWLPFHFLPGNEGGDIYERLICRKGGPLITEMLDHHLERSHEPWAVELMGVAAHVLSDSYSHWGFSGVSSPYNRVHNHSIRFMARSDDIKEYLKKCEEDFLERFREESEGIDIFSGAAGSIAESLSGALGHGGALVFPDYANVLWSFRYQGKSRGGKAHIRNNPEDFLEACEKVHAFLMKFAQSRPDLAGSHEPMEFSDLKPDVAGILETDGDKALHVGMWQGLMEWLAGKLNLKEASGMPDGGPIPEYRRELWDGVRDGFSDLDQPGDIARQPVYRFYQAAAFHRNYVLRELLPSHGLMLY